MMRLFIRGIMVIMAVCLTASIAIIFEPGIASIAVIGLIVGVTTGTIANITIGKLNETS